MKTLSAKQIGNDLVDALDELNKIEDESILIDLHGNKFVVLKEEDYQGWNETAYLLSSPKNSAILQNALKEPLDECTNLKDAINELDD
ncbi:MAG: type II toxin-antitoxin system Phd/YefM family antitoxin [Candidatus Anammoxibacter sp.]